MNMILLGGIHVTASPRDIDITYAKRVPDVFSVCQKQFQYASLSSCCPGFQIIFHLQQQLVANRKMAAGLAI